MGMDTKSRYRNMYQSEASGSNAGAVNSWGRTRRPKELRDPGPIIDCVTYYDGTYWQVLFDISGTGDMTQIEPMTDYRKLYQFRPFSAEDSFIDASELVSNSSTVTKTSLALDPSEGPTIP